MIRVVNADRLTPANRDAYVEAALALRLTEFDDAVAAVRCGIATAIPAIEVPSLRYLLHAVSEHKYAVALSVPRVCAYCGDGALLQVLTMLTGAELELLASGNPAVDFAALKTVTKYEGGVATEQTVLWFWEVLEQFEVEHRSAFLRFCWGGSRLPQSRDGLSRQRFILSLQSRDDADTQLPMAHTCFFQVRCVAALAASWKACLRTCVPIDTELI